MPDSEDSMYEIVRYLYPAYSVLLVVRRLSGDPELSLAIGFHSSSKLSPNQSYALQMFILCFAQILGSL